MPLRCTSKARPAPTPAVEIQLAPASHAGTRQSFTFRLNRAKWQAAERRDGHYLLRSNLVAADPAVLC